MKPMSRAAHLAHVALATASSRSAAVEQDAAAGDAAGRLQQPEDRQRGHRLAAAGFADESQRLAAAQSKLTSSTAVATASVP